MEHKHIKLTVVQNLRFSAFCSANNPSLTSNYSNIRQHREEAINYTIRRGKFNFVQVIRGEVAAVGGA